MNNGPSGKACCEPHSRNAQPCLSFGVRKYPELVNPESLYVVLLLLICQGRNQATSLEHKDIPHIYNINLLSVCSVQAFFKHCISFLW